MSNQYPQGPSYEQHSQPRPNLPYPGPHQQPPKKKSKARTVAICLFAGLGALVVIASAFGAGGTGDEPSKPSAVATVDNGPTPDPITTPTNKPSKPTQPAPQPKPTKTAPKLTVSQEQAIGSAESYLSMDGFSRKGLIQQLSSSYGEGFSVKDATFAVDYLKVNWNEQAARKAKSYLETQHFSRNGLIRQLESSYGEGFTHAQAVYGVNKAGL